jgi:O-methyltransferase
VLARDDPGDLIETGVWRGGSTIFMRAVLKAHGDRDRVVWVADSFQGLPKPDPSHADDVEDKLWSQQSLSVPLAEVRDNFRRYGVLDEQVSFLPGWFSDTLPRAPIERLAVLRLDGDLYESTMTALRALYPKLSVGGYVIVDDYHAVRGCRRAVDDFRTEHGVEDELHEVDWTCVYWRRSS